MTKNQIYSSLIFGILFIVGIYFFIPNLKKPQEITDLQGFENTYKKDSLQNERDKNVSQNEPKELIEKLTDEKVVVYYLKKYNELPIYYITKKQAREQGWMPEKGNLCETLPGRAIGGDRFGNRENKLPTGSEYYEADINYRCSKRTADRIVFNKKGDIWITKDHYKTFDKQ